MKETKTEFLGYDNDKSVFIDEELLISEVDMGLDRALEITDSLVTEANEIMSSVSDIIGLAPLSMEEFAENVMRAKSFIYDIVIANLYNIDAARESALVDIHESLKLIHTYFNSVEISFKDKAAIECFDRTDALMLPYLAQDDLFDEIAAGIKDGLHNYGVDFIEGMKNIPPWAGPFYPTIAFYSLLGNAGSIINSIKDSFYDDVINGDPKSIASWSTYAAFSLGDIFIGSKGAGTATKTSGWTGKGAMLNKGSSVELTHALQQTEKWKQIMGKPNLSGSNVLNKTKLQNDFLAPTQIMTQQKLFNRTEYKIPYPGESIDKFLYAAKLREESKVIGKGNLKAQFTKEQLAAKPSYSPAPDKWTKKGGTVS